MKATKLVTRIFTGLLTLLLVISIVPPMTAKAAGLQLYYYNTKQTVHYTDKQIRYVYNGTEVSLPGKPGILSSNGVALGPYYELCVKTMGLKYSKGSNSLTFKKGNTTLVLTIGSKTAFVNGQPVTMNAAPVNIKYKDSNISRILVPTRFVAETFGYSYSWDSATSTVTIKSALTLKYNNKQVSYTGTTGQVTVDGKTVKLTSLPSILISNTAMVRAYEVFRKAMGVSYSYNRTTGKIAFRKGDILLTMQAGSTIAYVNNEIKDCGVAPILVTNCENNFSALLVPGRFVAETLGYDYNWNSTTATSEIMTTERVGVYVPPVIEREPVEQVHYSFAVDETKYLEFENIVNSTVTEIHSDIPTQLSFLEDISLDPNEIFNETYLLDFLNPVSDISSVMDGNKLTLTIENTVCNNRTYNHLFGSLVKQIQQTCDYTTNRTILEFELSSATPYFHLELADDGMSCRVTIYPNYLVGLEMGTNRYGTYLRFKGLKNFTYESGIEGEYQVLYFRDTANTVGNIVFPDELFAEYFEYALMVETDPTQIKLLYKPQENSEFTYVEEANELYMYFNYATVKEDNQQLNQPLSIMLPEEVTFRDVKIQDDYLNEQFLITIPGQHTAFYQLHPIANTYTVVEGIDVLASGSDTVIRIKTSRIQGMKVQETLTGIQLTIDNPSKIYEKIVVLDAGHGGIDPGASAGGYTEKELNFTILNKYAKEYFAESDIKVYYTRLTDVKIDLYERADFATKVEADMFISLHMNAATATSANGTAVYYSLLNTSVNSGGLDSRAMAASLTNNLAATLGTKNNGVKTANFVVIKETQMPAVLIELAFITNSSDRKILTSASKQKAAAKTIYETVVNFFQTYPTGR